MNEPTDLPEDLASLEAALRGCGAEPPEELADRAVAAAMAARRRGRSWQFAAGLASAVLLGLNLAMTARLSPAPPLRAAPGPEACRQAYRQVRQAAPELSPEEAAAQALAITAAAQLQPYGVPRGSWPR